MDKEKLYKFVKLPTFDGDEEKFQLWLVRFEVYATCCEFRAAVGDEPEEELPTNEAIALRTTQASPVSCHVVLLKDETKRTEVETESEMGR